MNDAFPDIRIEYPDWIRGLVDWERPVHGDRDRMRVALAVARENVLRHGGGPFGAAIFEAESGRLVSVGVNLVVPLNASPLHAEVVAFLMAQARVRAWSLRADGLPAHVLYTSCEPCAMCLGATLWSGVRRAVWSAGREDAERIGFDEGPPPGEAHRYIRGRGVALEGGLLADEGREVLQLYRDTGGVIYNG